MVTKKTASKPKPKYRVSDEKIREVTTVRGAARAVARAHKKALERLQKD